MPSWGSDFIRGMWSSGGSPFGHPDPGVGVPSSGLQPSQLVGCSTNCWESARSFCVTASSVVPTSLAWHIAHSFIPPSLPSLRLSQSSGKKLALEPNRPGLSPRFVAANSEPWLGSLLVNGDNNTSCQHL